MPSKKNITRTRKNRIRKGGGKNFIIRGKRQDFQRILNIIDRQY